MNELKKPLAVILAAGSGRRFLGSGGTGYKQLTPYKGEPVIARLVRQVHDSREFDGITVVLGTDINCRAAIKQTLAGRNVNYAINHEAERDQNLLSFRVGINDVNQSVLLIESDCIVETQDIFGMVNLLQKDEIRWANLGDISNFDYGGIIEIDLETGAGLAVDVLSRNDFGEFRASGRHGVKMFGLTAFGSEALEIYRERIDALRDCHNKYFHEIAIREPYLFRLRTYRMAQQSFSFNTISELGHNCE